MALVALFGSSLGTNIRPSDTDRSHPPIPEYVPSPLTSPSLAIVHKRPVQNTAINTCSICVPPLTRARNSRWLDRRTRLGERLGPFLTVGRETAAAHELSYISKGI